MVKVTGLTKFYGQRTAIENLSFSVGKGEVVGFLGPNGAGKTTTMNIICGYSGAGKGHVEIAGIDMAESPEDAKRELGYLPERPPVAPNMTVSEYLRFVCEIKQVPRSVRTQRILRTVERTGLGGVKDRLIGNLSKGYQQRVGIAQAIVAEPPLIVLDEPTAGLDPRQIVEIRRLIQSLGTEHTVLLSSHVLTEVSALCRRLLIINNGRIVADGTPSEIAGGFYDRRRIEVEVIAAPEKVRGIVPSIDGIESFELRPAREEGAARIEFLAVAGVDIRRSLWKALVTADIPVLEMHSDLPSLEEVFVRLTSDESGRSQPSGES